MELRQWNRGGNVTRARHRSAAQPDRRGRRRRLPPRRRRPSTQPVGGEPAHPPAGEGAGASAGRTGRPPGQADPGRRRVAGRGAPHRRRARRGAAATRSGRGPGVHHRHDRSRRRPHTAAHRHGTGRDLPRPERQVPLRPDHPAQRGAGPGHHRPSGLHHRGERADGHARRLAAARVVRRIGLDAPDRGRAVAADRDRRAVRHPRTGTRRPRRARHPRHGGRRGRRPRRRPERHPRRARSQPAGAGRAAAGGPGRSARPAVRAVDQPHRARPARR